MTLSGVSTLTIARPGWVDKRELRVASVAANWRVNGVASLVARLPARDAWLLGVENYLDRWVRLDHPTMGTWGGICKQTRVVTGETLELSCRSFVRLLGKKRTVRVDRPRSGTPGELAWRALQTAPGERPLFDKYEIDGGGEILSVTWQADDRGQVIDRLASASGFQYDVRLDDDWSRVFCFGRRIGSDKTGDVLFAEGYQIGRVDITTDTDDLENNILAVSADDDWETTPWAIEQNGASVQQYGVAEGTRRYYGLRNATALRSRARAELALTALPSTKITIRVRDTEPLLREIRHGDTIRVWSATANAQYVVRIEQRSVNVDRGEVTLSGIAET